MTCYICKKVKFEKYFTRRGRIFKSCNDCSKSKSHKRREDRINGILSIYCPVSDIVNTITSLVLNSEESYKNKRKIKQILKFRVRLSRQYVVYFLKESELTAILMSHIIGMGDEQDLLDDITHMCLDFLMAYIRQKVLKSNAETHSQLIEDIMASSREGSYAGLIFDRVYTRMFTNKFTGIQFN